jgi:hypothetical protein
MFNEVRRLSAVTAEIRSYVRLNRIVFCNGSSLIFCRADRSAEYATKVAKYALSQARAALSERNVPLGTPTSIRSATETGTRR